MSRTLDRGWIQRAPATDGPEFFFHQMARNRVSGLLSPSSPLYDSLVHLLMSAYIQGFEDCATGARKLVEGAGHGVVAAQGDPRPTVWIIEWEEGGRIRYEPREQGEVVYDANLAVHWHSREAAENHLSVMRGMNNVWRMARVAEHEFIPPINVHARWPSED